MVSKIALQLVYPCLQWKDLLNVTLVSKEWCWNKWSESAKISLWRPLFLKRLQSTSSYDYEWNVAVELLKATCGEYIVNERGLHEAWTEICKRAFDAKIEKVTSIWRQRKCVLKGHGLNSSKRTILFNDGAMYLSQKNALRFIHWDTKPTFFNIRSNHEDLRYHEISITFYHVNGGGLEKDAYYLNFLSGHGTIYELSQTKKKQKLFQGYISWRICEEPRRVHGSLFVDDILYAKGNILSYDPSNISGDNVEVYYPDGKSLYFKGNCNLSPFYQGTFFDEKGHVLTNRAKRIAETSEKQKLCTFKLTRYMFSRQMAYYCITCESNDKLICQQCKEVCHTDHKTKFCGYQEIFCVCSDTGKCCFNHNK